LIQNSFNLRTELFKAHFSDPLNRSAAELGITSGTEAQIVAVLSGGNIDPTLLADILQTESYTG